MLKLPLAVDKARISSSYEVSRTGRVDEIRVPDFIDSDERGVLRATWVRGRR